MYHIYRNTDAMMSIILYLIDIVQTGLRDHFLRTHTCRLRGYYVT